MGHTVTKLAVFVCTHAATEDMDRKRGMIYGINRASIERKCREVIPVKPSPLCSCLI